jgi:hypothetical protein
VTQWSSDSLNKFSNSYNNEGGVLLHSSLSTSFKFIESPDSLFSPDDLGGE